MMKVKLAFYDKTKSAKYKKKESQSENRDFE